MTGQATNHNIKRVRDLLVKARTLKQLTQESRQIDQLNQRFLSRLPSMLAQYCRLKSYRNGRLIIHTHSATVATQLRFTTPQLIEQLRKTTEFSALQSLDIQRGTPERPTPSTTKKILHRSPVSKANTALIRDTAASVSSAELGDSLRKLARTLEQIRR